MTTDTPDLVGDSAVVLDACVVLNLYATGLMGEIVAGLARPVAVTAFTAEKEALWVGVECAGGAGQDAERVDLGPLIRRGSLDIVLVESDDEADRFLRLAGVVDEGEAMAAAIAISRGFAVATDDRKAIAVLSATAPSTALIRTSGIVRRWAEHERVSPALLADVLQRVSRRARFLPGPSDPLSAWWRSAAGPTP